MDGKPNEKQSEERFKVYRERWFVAGVVSFLQITIGALWINFSPIANLTAAYFGVDNYAVNWFSVSYFVTFCPFVFLAMWVIDEYGLKLSIYVVCILTIVGSLVRAIGTLDVLSPSWRYPVALTGQVIVSLSYPFLMSVPTKVSQDWFPVNERTAATTICSMTTAIGSALGSLISPLIVSDSNDIPLMNYIFCGLAVASGVLGLFYRNSRPPTPPSSSAKQLLETTIRKPYITELKKVLTNLRFLIYVVASGGITIGFSCALNSILEQMMCPWGYTNSFVGVCIGVEIGSGVVGAIFLTYLTDKTKMFEEILKISFGLSVPAYVAFVLTMGVDGGKYILVVLSVIMGILSTGALSISLEIAVEDTYPVDESISAGLIVLSGQIQAAVYVPLMSLLVQPLTAEQTRRQSCIIQGSTEANDMTYSGLLMVGLMALFVICLIIFYRPKYRRLEAETLEKLRSSTKSLPPTTVATIKIVD